MNRILLFIVFLTFITSVSFAQTKSTAELSFGGEFGFPAGQASQSYGSVFSASVKLELPETSRFDLVFTAGTTNFVLKYNYAGDLSNASFIPIEAGGKYYFSKIGYVEGDLGLSANVSSNSNASKTAFIYSPVIGFSAPTSKHKATIDIGLGYEDRVQGDGSFGQVALRVAYRFGLK